MSLYACLRLPEILFNDSLSIARLDGTTLAKQQSAIRCFNHVDFKLTLGPSDLVQCHCRIVSVRYHAELVGSMRFLVLLSVGGRLCRR